MNAPFTTALELSNTKWWSALYCTKMFCREYVNHLLVCPGNNVAELSSTAVELYKKMPKRSWKARHICQEYVTDRLAYPDMLPSCPGSWDVLYKKVAYGVFCGVPVCMNDWLACPCPWLRYMLRSCPKAFELYKKVPKHYMLSFFVNDWLPCPLSRYRMLRSCPKAVELYKKVAKLCLWCF